MDPARKTAEPELRPELHQLARALAQLDGEERERVIAAARTSLRFKTIPWDEFERAKGTAPVGGGDAVADTDALYDEC